MGGTWDATNVVDPAVAVVTPVGLDHQAYLGDTIEQIAAREGRDHQGRAASPCWRSRSWRPPRCCSRRSRRGRRDRRPRGARVRRGVAGRRRRRPAARPRGPRRGRTTTCSSRCTASTRPTTPPWRSPRSRRSSAAARASSTWTPCVRGFARRPRRRAASRSSAARPTVLVDAAHNPAGAHALSDARSTRPSRSTTSSAWSACSADKDARGIFEALEPVLDEVVITRSILAPGAGCR